METDNNKEVKRILTEINGKAMDDYGQFIQSSERYYVAALAYARSQSEEDIREGLPRKYGFHTNVATKPMIISNLIKVVREAMYTERDKRCLNEMLVYEKKQNGSYGAVVGEHDDLLMTRAIGLHICFNEMDLPRIVSRDANRLTALVRRPVSEATIG